MHRSSTFCQWKQIKLKCFYQNENDDEMYWEKNCFNKVFVKQKELYFDFL